MPYPYGYAGGQSSNPFWTAEEAAQAQQQNQQSMALQIQQAYIQREAAARAEAKQQHDFAVDDLEQRMKLQAGGAQPINADGNVSGTASNQYPSDISARIQGAAPAPDPDAQMSDDPGTRLSQLPLSLPGAVNANVPSSVSAGTPADPSRTVTTTGAGGQPGQAYQLPTLAEVQQRVNQNAADLETAKKNADSAARAKDLQDRGVPMGQTIADEIGGDPEGLILPEDRQKWAMAIAANIRAGAQKQNADTRANAPNTPKTKAQLAVDAADDDSPTQAQSAKALKLLGTGDGPDGPKPLTTNQLVQIASKKDNALLKASANYKKALAAANVAGVVDQKAVEEAREQYVSDQQEAQDAFEEQLSTAGYPVQHYDWATRTTQPSTSQPKSPQAPQPGATASPAAPAATAAPSAPAPAPAAAAAPQTNRPGPPAAFVKTMVPGKVYTFRNRQKWMKNPDGTTSQVR